MTLTHRHGSAPRALRVVKLAHTAVWAVLATSIIAIPIAARIGAWRLAAVLIALVSVECLVLIANGMRCPLTDVAARYTDDRADNFDIYLPLWLARYNKQVFGTLFVIGLLVTLLSACASPAGAGTAAAELRERELGYFAAQSDGDADQVAAHYAADAALHVADMPPIQGRDAIGGFYSNLLRYLSATTATPETVRVADSGDMGYTTGSVTNVFESGDGRVEYPGKYVLVWERRGGDWLIVLHGVSSNESTDGGR